MAVDVSWETLRELAGFRADKGCAISIYLSLDPSVTPTAGDADTRLNSLLAEGERSDETGRGDLSHEARLGIRADFERIRQYVGQDFDRDGSRGLAVFAAGLDETWSTYPLPESVQDAVKVGPQFYLAPLVPLLGRDGAVVAVVSRERGEVFRLRGGRLEELVDRTEEVPGQDNPRGGSQARYERHIDKLVAETPSASSAAAGWDAPSPTGSSTAGPTSTSPASTSTGCTATRPPRNTAPPARSSPWAPSTGATTRQGR